MPYGGVESRAVITATFSPGGQWVAYFAGPPGTFVQPFPASATKYQVAGGLHPFWSPDGAELFVGSRAGLRTVRITTKPAFAFGPPVDLPKARFNDRGPGFERNMDIMPDGKRFVVVVPIEESGAGAQIQVVEHWFEALKARVPIK